MGIPLALELESSGHNVVFSSYSFSDLSSAVPVSSFSSGAVIVDSDSQPLTERLYFPEVYMCQWFRTQGKRKKIYCYKQVDVKSLVQIFNDIADRESIDYHFVVDGGSDGILRGDEAGLGSPLIDAISIIAASESRIAHRYYILSAFGSEGVGDNEVSHAEVLRRMSELVADNGMYGVTSILNNPGVADDFKGAMEYIFSKMPPINKSIILSSIVHSIEGSFGHTAVNARTEQHPVWVSVLTSLLRFFDCDAVAGMKIYKTEVRDTAYFEGSRIIWDQWDKHYRKNKPRPHIPI